MISRRILQKLLGELTKPFVSILIGPRQVGKTVLMRMIEERVELKTVYLDVENPQDALVFSNGLESLIAEIGTGKQVLLLDEFHRLKDALMLFKQLRDAHPNIKVFASGSSSIEIHSHLNQSAVGRVRRTRIFPLSFPEWCQEKIDIPIFDLDPEKIMPPRQKKRLDDLLDEFLVWGGMPEPAVLSDSMEKREVLNEICALYLEKDVRSLLRDEEILRFNEFIRLMCLQLGQMMNRSRFGAQLGISSRQVEKQLKVMEHTFVYRPITTDYANPTKRLVKSPKIYWYDNGIRNAVVRDFRRIRERPDGGALLENHIYCELDKSAGVDIDILFHRTQDRQEVDFVLERDRQKLLIEVKSSLARDTIPRAIHEMLNREDVLGAAILNYRIHKKRQVNKKPVMFLPMFLAHSLPDFLRNLA
jgi:hypothetical protein